MSIPETRTDKRNFALRTVMRGREFERRRQEKRSRLRIFHINAGSCNGCDIELRTLALANYDFVDSVRKADVLVVTGIVTRSMREILVRVCKKAAKKPMVALGSCSISHGVIYGSEAADGFLDEIFPISAYVFGCPPRPREIAQGLRRIKKIPKT